MSKFLAELNARLKGNRVWLLESPLVYQSDMLGCDVEIPENFETDLASVPRIPIVYSF